MQEGRERLREQLRNDFEEVLQAHANANAEKYTTMVKSKDNGMKYNSSHLVFAILGGLLGIYFPGLAICVLLILLVAYPVILLLN